MLLLSRHMEALKAENARLLTENARLLAENAQLKSAVEASARTAAPDTLEGLAKIMAANHAAVIAQVSQGSVRPPAWGAGEGPLLLGPVDEVEELAETLYGIEHGIDGDSEHGLNPEQVVKVREVFNQYQRYGRTLGDSTTTLDTRELVELLRICGVQDVSEESVELMLEDVDANKNGNIELNEFLMLYARVVIAHTTDDEGVSTAELEPIDIREISEYGIYALMRWIHHDPDYVGPNTVDSTTVPCLRANARKIVLNKHVELVFYAFIAVSAINDGIQTNEKWTEHPLVITLNTLTLVVFAFEVLVKFVSDASSKAAMIGFFSDYWNIFDTVTLSLSLSLSLFL
eukprot:COSAG01_NODE_45_length_32100_cov_28.037218_14_plen_345_part_00